MTPQHKPEHRPEWEDVPLIDLPGETITRKPAAKPDGVKWVELKHRRWACEECVVDLPNMEAKHPGKATSMRHQWGESIAYCDVHAGDQKVRDEKEGLWRTKK